MNFWILGDQAVLSWQNDEGKTFSEIADIIERQWQNL